MARADKAISTAGRVSSVRSFRSESEASNSKLEAREHLLESCNIA